MRIHGICEHPDPGSDQSVDNHGVFGVDGGGGQGTRDPSFNAPFRQVDAVK